MSESKSPRDFALHLATYAHLEQHARAFADATSRGEVGPKFQGILSQQGRPRHPRKENRETAGLLDRAAGCRRIAKFHEDLRHYQLVATR